MMKLFALLSALPSSTEHKPLADTKAEAMARAPAKAGIHLLPSVAF